MSDSDRLTLAEAAELAGVTTATLKRWAASGVIPEVDGDGQWTPAATAHARIVARLRERGHSLRDIATDDARTRDYLLGVSMIASLHRAEQLG